MINMQKSLVANILSGTMAILKLKKHPPPPPITPRNQKRSCPNDDPADSLFIQVFKITNVISILQLTMAFEYTETCFIKWKMSLFTYSYKIFKLLKTVYRQRLTVGRVCSLYESSSSPSQVRLTSQVRVRFRFFYFLFSFCFVFVFIKGCDCDSCFHNNVPTDVRSIKHDQDIIVNAIARIHCSVAN